MLKAGFRFLRRDRWDSLDRKSPVVILAKGDICITQVTGGSFLPRPSSPSQREKGWSWISSYSRGYAKVFRAGVWPYVSDLYS